MWACCVCTMSVLRVLYNKRQSDGTFILTNNNVNLAVRCNHVQQTVEHTIQMRSLQIINLDHNRCFLVLQAHGFHVCSVVVVHHPQLHLCVQLKCRQQKARQCAGLNKIHTSPRLIGLRHYAAKTGVEIHGNRENNQETNQYSYFCLPACPHGGPL
jgi:hypothetical protein